MAEKRARVRLRDSGTIFKDPESGWTISGKQEKAIPARPGQALKARIRMGALILVDDSPSKKQEKKAPEAGDQKQESAPVGGQEKPE